MSKIPVLLSSLFCMILIHTRVHGQSNAQSDSPSVFKRPFVAPYAGFAASYLKTEFQNGDNSAKPADAGFELGVKGVFNASPLIGFETGIGFGRQYHYFTWNHSTTALQTSGMQIEYFQVPLMLQVRGELGKRFHVYLAGGACAKFMNIPTGSSGHSFSSGNAGEVSGFTMKFKSVDSNSVDLVSNFEVGAYYRLANNNMLRLNAAVQLSPGFISQVDYQLVDRKGNPLGIGTYYVPVSYTGFSFAYVFTFAPKK